MFGRPCLVGDPPVAQHPVLTAAPGVQRRAAEAHSRGVPVAAGDVLGAAAGDGHQLRHVAV